MEPAERLRLLVANNDWSVFRSREMQLLMDRSRGIIRTWAPSMVQSKPLAAIMDDVIGLFDRSSEIALQLIAERLAQKSHVPNGNWFERAR